MEDINNASANHVHTPTALSHSPIEPSKPINTNVNDAQNAYHTNASINNSVSIENIAEHANQSTSQEPQSSQIDVNMHTQPFTHSSEQSSSQVPVENTLHSLPKSPLVASHSEHKTPEYHAENISPAHNASNEGSQQIMPSDETNTLNEMEVDEQFEKPSQVDNIVIPTDKDVLNEEQLKYCMNILKTIKKHRDALPFLLPVDPVALSIPDYPLVIKKPMDLSTIEKKLNAKEYSNAEFFAEDFRLMLSNCFTYNPAETPVHKMGRRIETQFDNFYKRLPTDIAQAAALNSQKSATVSAVKERKRSLSVATEHAKKRNVSSAAGAATNAASFSPVEGSETPKFPRRAASSKSKVNADELKNCLNVWREVTKKTNIVWPFMQPVDPVALGIPDYFTVIKEPMDFGTIKKKIDSGVYSSFGQFERDCRLVFSNCYTYNAPESDVVILCRQAEGIFNTKVSTPSSMNRSTSKSFGGHSATSSTAPHDDSDDDGIEDSDSEKVKALKLQIQAIKAQIAAINQKRKFKKANTKHTSVATETKKASSTPSYNKERKKVDELTFEEKKNLSSDINILPPEELNGVVEIIQESLPALKNGASEEIELDIDSLDVKTLRKLQDYVKKYKMRQLKTSAAAGGVASGAQNASAGSTIPPLAGANPAATGATSQATSIAPNLSSTSEDEFDSD